MTPRLRTCRLKLVKILLLPPRSLDLGVISFNRKTTNTNMTDTRPRRTDRRVMSPSDRLNIYSERDSSGCLIYTRGGSAAEYPRIWVDGKKMTTSRAQWTVLYGEPPAGIVVRHKCDVRNCIEPTHLELGTYAENTADMHERGRSNAKLDRSKADEIRELRLSGTSVDVIAERYGVSRMTVYNIINRKIWK